MAGATDAMSISQMLQFYTPLVGLLVVAFMLGGLSNRVRTLERERKDDRDALAAATQDGQSDHDTLIVLAADMKAVKETLVGMGRDWHGVQRQLANIATGKPLTEFRSDG